MPSDSVVYVLQKSSVHEDVTSVACCKLQVPHAVRYKRCMLYVTSVHAVRYKCACCTLQLCMLYATSVHAVRYKCCCFNCCTLKKHLAAFHKD